VGEKGVGLRARIYRDRELAVLRCLDQADLPAGSGMLDISREAGEVTIAAIRKGYRVSLLVRLPANGATSAARLAAAGHEKEVTILTGGPSELSFPDGSLDIVTALNIFPWETSPGRALDEVRRVLKPGGYFITSFHNRWRLPRLFDPRLHPAIAPSLRKLKRWSERRRGLDVSIESSLPVNHTPGEVTSELAMRDLRAVGRLSAGFGPFTFLGKRVMPDRWGIAVHAFLQRLANRHFPFVWNRGSYYIILARKEQGTHHTATGKEES